MPCSAWPPGPRPWACIRSWCDCTKRSSSMAASGNRLKLFASPWSPPAFMKDNNDMLHGGHLREYDWRKVEARLSALPQFVTTIDGLDIHFIHVRSKHT